LKYQLDVSYQRKTVSQYQELFVTLLACNVLMHCLVTVVVARLAHIGCAWVQLHNRHGQFVIVARQYRPVLHE